MNKNLIEIYKDTKETANSFFGDFTNTESYTFNDIKKYDVKPENKLITVENIDTVGAINKYSKLGKTCGLNMASYKRPGGGVERGARAQEECLFRSSNLCNLISNEYYPLKYDTALYTKESVFFKDFNYSYIDECISDIITIAAVNLNGTNFNMDNYEDLTKNKIRLILSLAIENNVEYLILGAWGCGVFKNDPNVMATYFKEILAEGYSSYLNVIFAVINDHNADHNNYTIFKDILNG